MKTTFKHTLIVLLAMVSAVSCGKYLDIVPDNVATIDNAFTTRAQAKKYLFTCYSYLPNFCSPQFNPALFGGDEITCYPNYRSSGHVHAWYIQRGYQSATTDERCNYWQGNNGAKDLYQGIRDCNIFMENVSRVPDLEAWERDQWIQEAKFLKAYFHFYLVRMYGPVPIKDVNLEIDADIDAVRVFRNTLDECFDYIVKTLDEVLQSGKLPDKIENEATELGRITNGIVRAVKAEVLIYAASPLFNGNTDYTNFKDGRGVEIYSPQKSDAEKLARWQAAATACAEAIEFLEGQGLTLYSVSDKSRTVATNIKMSIRGAVSEPWNSELVWGYTGERVRALQLQSIPRGLYSSNGGTMGNSSVPVQIAALFYTRNGVPIDEDVTWDYSKRYDVATVPEADFALMKSGYETVKFNLDREYRYYADLAFDGNVWFGQGKTDESNPTYIQCKNGQTCSNVTMYDYNMTGIWPKKYVNAGTIRSSSTTTYVDYPWPVIRLSGLYLYYAEALNECGESYERVLEYLNPIRERAGIPDVATSWDTYTTSPGKYKTQEGLRQIIHRERAIELCFEGQRFWDLRRWKEAVNELNKPITGWNLNEKTADLYFSESLVYIHSFEIKDYFWPVPNQEIYANPNTVQNYGW